MVGLFSSAHGEKRGCLTHMLPSEGGASGITEDTEHVLQRGTRDQESLERQLLTGVHEIEYLGKGTKGSHSSISFLHHR